MSIGRNDRVRSTSVSPPLAGAFAASDGSPIVIDESNAGVYVMKANQAVVEFARDGGWQDYLSSISAGKAVGANAPTWATIRAGISAYSFSAGTMNEIWMNFHILHDYKTGTMFYPHIHWTTTGTNTGVCRWGIEYTFARGYGIDVFPAPTTIYLQQAASGTPYTHYIVEATEGNGVTIPTLETDGILMMRVFRDAANAADTLTDAAFGIFVDMHYQSDGMLTVERNRPFTKQRGL